MKINLFNVIKYYKDLPHQNTAISILENYINQNKDIVDKFFNVWRKQEYYYLLMKPTNDKDSAGLIKFNLHLIKGATTVVSTLSVRSGSPSAQILRPAEEDYSGSMRPIPEGEWIVHNVEKSPVGSWGEGIGEYWIELTPINPKHNRKNIGIHIDANIEYSPGSAGCVVTTNRADMEKIISWVTCYNITKLLVDYGFSNKEHADIVSAVLDKHAKFAIGYAEGNLTLDGKPTANYYGHRDPGNGRYNIGAFSYQGSNATTPEEADAIWLNTLKRNLANKLNRLLDAYDQKCHIPIILNTADLYTQAPLAVVDKGGLLDLLASYTGKSVNKENFVMLRVKSFYDPNGRLLASGFNNDVKKLESDQRRRVEALFSYMAKYKLC